MSSHDTLLSSDDSSRRDRLSDSSKDGLDKVELSDLDSTPPKLPIEQDLMQLARLGELRAIQKLFDSGTYNAKSRDDQGITALHWAAINGHHALCHFLLQSGAEVNAKGGDAEATPVLWASKRCHLQVLQLLLANGADPLARDDQGYNLLHSATLDGNILQLTLLLHQPDLPVDVPDTQGHTSLMWAAYKGYPSCIDLLLRWGANMYAVDDMGFTALHWALVKGNYACIQELVQYGSDRFAVSKAQDGATEGDTPAMTAAKMKSDVQWRKALLDSGFDEHGNPISFPIPFVKDRRLFFQRFFFLWPFVLGGLQLHMLAYMLVYLSIPGVLIVGYALQYTVQKLFRWAPSEMNSMHKTPFLAGIFAATFFWVGVRYVFAILPNTCTSNFFLNIAFATCYGFCAHFYYLTMTSDPGYIPKSSSRGQTKKTIDELLDHSAFNEQHFCTLCMIRKPLRSKHCRRCGRCVAKEDHHCPWVDNCVAVNNHKHFVLYILFLILGIGLLIRLTLAYIEALPSPPSSSLHCEILSPELCAQWSKDPLTLVTNAWAALQLSWTFMLVFVHFTQIARGVTTYESMRTNHLAPNSVTSALTSGTLDPEIAGLTASGGGPDLSGNGASGHAHGKAKKKKDGFFASWSRTLGLDVFFTIAFQGYNKTRDPSSPRPVKRSNPFTRGVVRNCTDFWGDGGVFGGRESGVSMLGGERVDYRMMYEVPRGGGGSYRGGYEAVDGGEEEV
ncbi:hypothetical protein B0A48_09146 [Cryoendolithus antarcticus]|uniref:Palmitoyltransferase n=1 Tax=Cryoendolithus antarcticus TaxID=1507870 RepID=A0A1V8T2D2_9PEZI|nr:hypothetical protein B0A48_09146 [Cryoendolithus antarcticus]